MTNKIIIVVALALLIGCAGSSFKFENARQVTVGMTEAQLIDRMGDPYKKIGKKDYEIWIWSHANGLSGKSQSVSFIMKDGKVSGLPTIPKSFD
jgi:hypothetical protein